MTVGKRVQFDEETWAVVNLLRQERRRSFQQFGDEAFADLADDQRYYCEPTRPFDKL